MLEDLVQTPPSNPETKQKAPNTGPARVDTLPIVENSEIEAKIPKEGVAAVYVVARRAAGAVCEPCQAMDPKMEEFSKDYAAKVKMFKVDSDAELPGDFNGTVDIRGVPAVFIYKNGRVVDRVYGNKPDELKQKLDKVIGG